jgi:hypothetical protein
MLTRFDAYTATTRAIKGHDFFPMLVRGGDKFREGKGHHGFAHRASFSGVDGSEAASVSWGGTHGDLVMVEAKGERTPSIVERLRAACEHHCTRVDSCHDVEAPGAFETLLEPCLNVKRSHKLKGSKAGDWEDFPEDGRTLYIGANSSPVKLRLYEKGHQPEYRHLNRPDWVRIELQVRPTKEAKQTYSRADSLAVWGASRWTRELAGLVLAAELAPLPAGTVYKLTEQDRALRWMCKQYGVSLIGLHNDLGGWSEVGVKLGEMVRAEIQRGKVLNGVRGED